MYTLATRHLFKCSIEKREALIEEVARIVELATISRESGLLSLENELETMPRSDVFLKTALMLVVDGTEPELVDQILSAALVASGRTGRGLLRRYIIKEGALAVQAGVYRHEIAVRLLALLGEDVFFGKKARKFMDETFTMESDTSLPLKTDRLRKEPADLENFTFDDLSTFRDMPRDMQLLLKEVDQRDIAVALKDADEQMARLIYRCMTKRVAAMIREEMLYLGPIKKEDSLKAQEKIAQIAQRLISSKEIIWGVKHDENSSQTVS